MLLTQLQLVDHFQELKDDTDRKKLLKKLIFYLDSWRSEITTQQVENLD